MPTYITFGDKPGKVSNASGQVFDANPASQYFSPDQLDTLNKIKYTGSVSPIGGGGVTQYFEHEGKQYSTNISDAIGGDTVERYQKILDTINSGKSDEPLTKPMIPIYTSPGVKSTPEAEVNPHSPAVVKNPVNPQEEQASEPFFMWAGAKGQPGSQGAGGGTTPGSTAPSVPGGYKDTQAAADHIAAVSTDTSNVGPDTKPKTITDIINEAASGSGQYMMTAQEASSGKAGIDAYNKRIAALRGGQSLASDISGAGAESNPPGLPNPDLGAAPTFSKYQDEQMLRGTYGIDSMTSQVESIDQQIADVTARTNDEYAKLQTEKVSTRVRGKQMAMIRAQDRAEKSALISQRQLLTKQLSDANKSVSMIMARDAADYATAKATWNKENNANLKYINAFAAGTTPAQKQAKSTLQIILNGIKPGQTLTADQKQTMDQLVLEVYGPEFVGIENAGLSGVLYSHTIRSNGKNYLMTLTGNPDGTYKIEYTAPVKAPAKQYGTISKADYQNIYNTYGLSQDDVNGILDAYNKGTSLDSLRSTLRSNGADAAALDWIMHYYAPLTNARPATAPTAAGQKSAAASDALLKMLGSSTP